MSASTKRRRVSPQSSGISEEDAATFRMMAMIPHEVIHAYQDWVAASESESRESSTAGLIRFAKRHGVTFDDSADETAPEQAHTAPQTASYGASPTKSGRRTKAAIQAIRDTIADVVAEFQPMTVRQVFYQLVSRGVIQKTEAEYKQTVCRLLVQMRRDGDLPYGWIADNTRWMRKPTTYGSLGSLFENCQRTYRRALWDDQEVYVEVWLEKEALAGVLVDVTAEWDVPLMVTRGYPSISYLHSAGEVIANEDRPVYIYYFGDRDPSGVDIDRFVEREIRRHAPDCDLCFERVAVTEEQIAELKLQTRPTKKSDSRSHSFKGRSVEVDAIHPDELRRICRDCIEQHIDDEQLERTQAVEAAERQTLKKIAANYGGAA